MTEADTKESAQNKEQKTFFVSFTGANADWAEWIAYELEEARQRVIFQKWDFRAGRNIPDQMQQAILEADCTIAVLSPAYLKSPFATAEWAAAFYHDPASRADKLLPVRVEPCEPEKMGLFATIAYIDLTDCDEETARRRLLKGLDRSRHKPSTAPRFPGTKQTTQAANDAAASHRAKPHFPGTQSNTATPDAQTQPNQEPARPTSTPPISPSNTKKVYVSYALEDLDMFTNLNKHLSLYRRNKQIECLDGQKLPTGTDRKSAARSALEQSHIAFLLISAAYLDSDDCYDEMEYIMQLTREGNIAMIPVLVRKARTVEDTPLKDLILIPRNGKPIDQWANKDSAWSEIVDEFIRVFKGL